MIVRSDLKSALREYKEHTKGMLTADDLSHIDRWLKKAMDPIWENVAEGITASGQFNNAIGGPLAVLVFYALSARRSAKEYNKLDVQLERHKAGRTRDDLLALASKMEDVVQSYLACKIAHEKHAPPPDADKHPAVLAREESLAWLQKDAQRIRERAAAKPKDPYDVDDFFEIRLSRQSKGQRHSESRAISIFVQYMVFLMRECIGKPRWHWVAALTNVAFPAAYVGEEEVRSRCKPTRRAERQKKPVHSNVKSDKKRL
jgi:hypothetical protein